jgi:hypothetical protein
MTKRKTPQENICPGLSAEDAATIRNAPEGTTYITLWRNKYLAIDAASFDEFRTALADAVALLDRWKALGIELQDDGVPDDYATFYTTSKQIALAEGFMPEPECEDDDEEGPANASDIAEIGPLALGAGCTWTMTRDNLPASPAALITELAKREAELVADDPSYEPFDAQRLAASSGLCGLYVRFDQWFKGKEPVKKIGDFAHDLTFAEILFELHKSVLKDKLGDHIYFEGLIRVHGQSEIPLFDVFMGS